jgi:hypothetical protein
MGPSSPSFSSEIEKLFQRSVSPETPLSDTEREFLDASYAILELNYVDIDDFLDGDPFQNPIIESNADETAFTMQKYRAIRYFHNYLAALYSFNEHIRALVNRKTAESIPSMERLHFLSMKEMMRSDYSRKITFLHGLRTDAQHGDYSGIKFAVRSETDDEIRFHMKFDEHGFTDSDLGSMSDYLHHTRRPEREYPFSFISGFHRNEFQHFYNDTINWFKRGSRGSNRTSDTD